VEARSTVYFNDGGGRRFTPVPFGDTRGTVYGIDIGDFDEDGRPDLAVAKSDAPNAVYFGSGAITCARPTSSSARSATPGARITPSSPSRAATQQDDERRRIDPPGLAPLVPAYSVAIRDGDLVFVSGMTGVKPGTQDIVEGGIAAQTRQTLTNIRTALTAAGATMAEVGECTVYLVDMTDYAAMNAVYIEFFPQAPPSRATVAVSALPRPTARVEIKCSARARRPSR
jgi:2-iminobutanoate/2-iminopropanoate deaminase